MKSVKRIRNTFKNFKDTNKSTHGKYQFNERIKSYQRQVIQELYDLYKFLSLDINKMFTNFIIKLLNIPALFSPTLKIDALESLFVA